MNTNVLHMYRNHIQCTPEAPSAIVGYTQDCITISRGDAHSMGTGAGTAVNVNQF